MREQPQADELLRYARDILRQEIIPALPKEHRLTGFMIANAMGIAVRQLQTGDEQDYQELIALKALLQTVGHDSLDDSELPYKAEADATADNSSEPLLLRPVLSHTELHSQITDLNGKLATLIRKRALVGHQALVLRHLEQVSSIRATQSTG